jgi:2-keto-4-pentenoate hydratase/2-oxohepta-3-ene-1,7-dioic acid hydratase in catechol pathway
MRLVTYQSANGPRLGVVRGDQIVTIPKLDMLSLIEQGDAGLDAARNAAGAVRSLKRTKLMAPIASPRRNVLCVGMNYAAHAAEGMRARGVPIVMPKIPVFFTKNTLAVIGPNDDISFHANATAQLDWEVELAVVIGKRGINIKAEDAMDHVFGYTVVNDVSARDRQAEHQQFFKGKSMDGTCPMGPWIITKDEVPDPHALPLRCKVNGVLKQNSTTADFIFNIPIVIEWLSKGMTLLPGDVIATGTPEGVGFARTPAEFLGDGDVVECEVEGVGTIKNKVVRVG